jgi:hypothetical protein
VKKLAIVVALCGSLISPPVHAKTFVGVLWPLFGPGAAIGLVELVAELKTMPDVEVSTYLHQSWPSLVEDIDRQPPGTHTFVIGYSLGANSSVLVANQARTVDLIIALQPSTLTSTPPVRGNVGRMIEFYNPNPLMTFGGMGSRKLVGENIEYIANNDSHLWAPFNLEFRNLVKSEIAQFAADDRLEAAQAEIPKPLKLAQPPRSAGFKLAEERLTHQPRDLAANGHPQIAQAEMPKVQKQVEPVHVAEEPPKQPLRDLTGFLNGLSTSVNSGDVFVQRQLTNEDMKDYVQRSYRGSPPADLMTTTSN